jgi:hypothetical protein
MIKIQSSKSLPFAIPRSSPGRQLNPDTTDKLTLGPNVATGGDSEDEQEADEQESLEGVRGHALSREDHRSNELSLSGAEASSKDHGETTAIGR